MTYQRYITPRYFRRALILDLYRTTYIPPKEETKR